ncbi:MAG: hypothetical protein OEV74_17545 [Cyclobacteriaceae bacterium]|nr:hypothetical protein [Cyclobacteriaceae bacterium]MDH5250816.1 hypothetical protein [Cyclobacteriaceae bacterium]
MGKHAHTIPNQTSSMYQPGLGQSLAWHGHTAGWAQSEWYMRGHSGPGAFSLDG